ncbi:3-phytase A [Aspergillus sclerotialis]|uniref:Phytase A n=1 Tax=Aspergillus sclerotialis TaxID=2070753 RepID=A0A3A2ZC54_9EURO|nr:3-phytase A [Aspergillus sclerotialis]
MGIWSVLFVAFYCLSSLSEGVLVPRDTPCNTVDNGYQCYSNTSHLWGQYSPYFSLADESAISADIPRGCEVTFVQMLSRHGARFPTSSKGKDYKALVEGIQQNATKLAGKYAFLRDYEYNMGEDDLTGFGENELVDSGLKFYERYESLARNSVPFIRASGQDRVIASAEKFSDGFEQAKSGGKRARKGQERAKIDVIIPEGDTFNDTLNHGTCTKFEETKPGDEAEDTFVETFTSAIRKRLEADMPGVSLTNKDVVHLMDLCPFDTISATSDAKELSPFCDLFTEEEWENYNYAKSVEKYYGYGAGNSLGPTQGIGFVNELIARLTRSPVIDHTSTNHTLDDNPKTFPLDRALYADFGHDNPMTSTFFALGLYNNTKPLPKTSIQDVDESGGYSAAWTVPFAARMYFEMMQCRTGEGRWEIGQPLVRALVNDQVVRLSGCDGDELGRCQLDDFVEGLTFVRSGGNWDECFS